MSAPILPTMSQGLFAPHVGDTFRVALPECGGSVELELLRADELPVHPGPGRDDPFVLEFRGPRDPSLAQGIWRFEHETLAALDIFVVPVGPDEHGLCYEAIFN